MRKVVLALMLTLLLGVAPGLPGSASADTTGTSGGSVVQTALQYLGYAYTTVGNSPSTGFSCIGFVSYVYQANGIPLPDDLWGAMGYAPAVSFYNLLPGDVLYFQNTVWAGLSHTGIYLGGGRFVHAEWYNRGVVISSFTGDPVDGDYWMSHYLGANRPWSVTVAPAVAPVSAAPASSSSTAPAAATPPSPPKPVLQDGPRARIQVAGLNVRLRPSLFAPVVRLATQGTKVVVLKQYRSWDWVQLSNGSYGWVSGAAIGVGSQSSAPSGLVPQPLPLTTTSVNGLRVHTRPNLDSPVIASAFHRQKLLVLKHWNGWLRILLPDGARGWVDGSFVASGDVQPAQSNDTPADHAATSNAASDTVVRPTITATVRVHSRPGLSAPVLGLAAHGAHVHLLDSWNGWIQVRLPGGVTGWVDHAYVHLKAQGT